MRSIVLLFLYTLRLEIMKYDIICDTTWSGAKHMTRFISAVIVAYLVGLSNFILQIL